jgi:hypothetical protein
MVIVGRLYALTFPKAGPRFRSLTSACPSGLSRSRVSSADPAERGVTRRPEWVARGHGTGAGTSSGSLRSGSGWRLLCAGRAGCAGSARALLEVGYALAAGAVQLWYRVAWRPARSDMASEHQSLHAVPKFAPIHTALGCGVPHSSQWST